MAKRSAGFNTPFEKLKLPPRPVAPPKPPVVAPPPAAPMLATDDAIFDDAMRTVAPLPPDPRGRIGSLGARLEIGRPARRARADDEIEAYAELADLVDGEGSFDISSTDEHMEGLAPGIDRRLLRQLRRGDYAIQAHLDLHGLIQTEAHEEVEQFIVQSRLAGRRCVLIVHGRGLHSKDAEPVLKERMKVWLTRGRIARSVLAFCTARPADGGGGAVYVLLRR